MAFFEDLSRKVQDVAFAAAEKGKEVAAIASEKAQDAADTVKTNVAIAGEQRAIEKNYRAIGEWYVSELKGEAPEAVADIVAAIRASQARIAAPNVPTSPKPLPRPLPPKHRSRRPLKRLPRLPFRSKRTAHKKGTQLHSSRVPFFMSSYARKPLRMVSSASSAVRPRVWSLRSWSPAILPMAAS